jgi:hypothetical protein
MTGLLNDLATPTSIRLSSLSAGPDAMMVGVVFTGPTEAIVPILLKRDKPQDRVRKSTCSVGGATRPLQAVPACASGAYRRLDKV